MPPELLPFLSLPVLMFLTFALGALSTAILMVLSPNPVRSALFLVLNLFCVAVLYLLLNSYFLAAVQVIVYAGAIMVLFLFVIMLLNLGTPDRAVDRLRWQQPVAVVAGLILAGIVGWTIYSAVPTPPQNADYNLGNVEVIGKNLYDPAQPWLFPFEVDGVLLLIAAVGSVVLAKRRPVGEGK